MNITIQCFGAFRPFGENIAISVADGATVADMRAELLGKLIQIDPAFRAGMLDSSRFATETAVLSEATILNDGAMLAIIPPVSGG